MDDWYVQVKGLEGDDERSILLCGRGYRQHPQLDEQMSAGHHGKTQSA